MRLLPFTPIGNSFTLAATVANLAQQMLTAPLSPSVPMNLRVVNETAAAILVAQGDATVNALTDTTAESVPAGATAILNFKGTATYVAVATRAGAGNVQVQLGAGV